MHDTKCLQEFEISIIVPVFNSQQFLPLLIQSLRQQTYQNFEVLFVDDGSTDSSTQIIESIVTSEKRFKLLKQINSGPSVARNTGLRHSTGQWIIFVDSDDYLMPKALQTLIQSATTGLPDVVITNAFRFVHHPDQVVEPEILIGQPWGQCVSGADWIIQTVKSRNWRHYIWSHFYKKEFLERHQLQFQPGLIHEDILWSCLIGLNARQILFNNVITYGYRYNSESIIDSTNRIRSLNRLIGYKTVIFELIRIGNSIVDAKLKSALLTQAIIEAGHMTGLLRKRLQPDTDTAAIAIEVLRNPKLKILFKAARTASDVWRLIRFYRSLRRHHSRGLHRKKAL